MMAICFFSFSRSTNGHKTHLCQVLWRGRNFIWVSMLIFVIGGWSLSRVFSVDEPPATHSAVPHPSLSVGSLGSLEFHLTLPVVTLVSLHEASKKIRSPWQGSSLSRVLSHPNTWSVWHPFAASSLELSTTLPILSEQVSEPSVFSTPWRNALMDALIGGLFAIIVILSRHRFTLSTKTMDEQ